ncbi:hypothetical protein VDS28_10090 [Xanthomonas campestris pv. campestris]|nr:hypothetical protein [Xanthomonas campestris pv. campestris]
MHTAISHCYVRGNIARRRDSSGTLQHVRHRRHRDVCGSIASAVHNNLHPIGIGQTSVTHQPATSAMALDKATACFFGACSAELHRSAQAARSNAAKVRHAGARALTST